MILAEFPDSRPADRKVLHAAETCQYTGCGNEAGEHRLICMKAYAYVSVGDNLLLRSISLVAISSHKV